MSVNHELVGCTIGFFAILGIYWSNVWYSAYLVPNSNQAFDRFGAIYNITGVLSADKTLDVEAYRQYSPMYFGAGYNIVIAGFFASYSAILVYAALEHGPQIKVSHFPVAPEHCTDNWQNGLATAYRKTVSFVRRSSRPEESHNRPEYDIHYAIMYQYKEVPQWAFILILVFSLVTGIIMVEVYNTTMPVWGIFVCLALAFIFLIPAGIIQALSNMQVRKQSFARDRKANSRIDYPCYSRRNHPWCCHPWKAICQHDLQTLRMGCSRHGLTLCSRPEAGSLSSYCSSCDIPSSDVGCPC